jgi:hypothetical protein
MTSDDANADQPAEPAMSSPQPIRRPSAAIGGGQVEIRLRGTRRACAATARRLDDLLLVTHTSGPYPDREARGRVRVYLHVRAPGGDQA